MNATEPEASMNVPNAHPPLAALSWLLIVVILTICVPGAAADESALIRIDTGSAADRNALIDAGVTLVAVTGDALLAVGSPAQVAAEAGSRALATTILADAVEGEAYALVGLRAGVSEDELAVCGRVLARGDAWRLVEGAGLTTPECLESAGWFIHRLDMEPLRPTRKPDAAAGNRRVPDPLVQQMVDQVDDAFVLSHWAALSESPSWTTRYSPSQGCADAATYVHDLFTSFGLTAEYQPHTSGYADNVIGTRPGIVDPSKVYIAIAHLDDLPSSGIAPGADDNASGSAMVTALAEIMSGYCFDYTTKFIAVTGEEQGLNGSDFYANAAAAANEDIQAVLNGDMIGWEGDGLPAAENLDVNYDATSQWLAQAMVAAAADYGTGLAVNAFSCASMVYSDHAPFWFNGYSAICGITDNEGFCGQGGDYPYYHQSSDTIANCGPGAVAFETKAVKAYLATLAHLAQPVAPVPDPPGAVSAQGSAPNSIEISWADQGPGLTYSVYRSIGSCSDPGPPVHVGDTASTQLVDVAVSGGVPYAYTVAASLAAGCTSQLSACVEATTTGSCDEPPDFAGVGSVSSAGLSTCRLDLDWQPPEHVWCGGPVVYNVYRDATAGFTPSPANRIAQIPGTAYSDLDVTYPDRYHYIVRAVDSSNGAEDDNLVEVAAMPTGPAIIGTWTDDAGDSGDPKLVPSNPWSVSPAGGVTGAAYATGHYPSSTCAAITSPPLLLDTSPLLEFWSKFDIENDWDKGELQISTDGGGSWTRVAMTYPGSSTHTNDQCNLGTGQFFTGSQTSFAPFTAALSAWSGQEVLLRWLFSSDSYIEGDGWWVDDISVTNVAVPGSCEGTDLVFADGFESGDTSAWSF